MADAWRGEYFANQNLAGAPALVRDDDRLSFNWGNGSPGPGLPADHFSVRWTRVVHFEAGLYRFAATADDGIRLFVDGTLVIDRWQVSSAQTYTADVTLAAGEHDLRVEYFEAGGLSQVSLGWDLLEPQALATGSGWRAEYFNNRALSGGPTLVRDDPEISFDWGEGSPHPTIAADNFSVRWTRTLTMPADTFHFYVHVNGGVRLYVDGALIVNQWHDANDAMYEGSASLAAGEHDLTVEFYDYTGPAGIELWWQAESEQRVGNIVTCMRPQNSWIKIYRRERNGAWTDLNPRGFGPLSADGSLKLDGMQVDPYYGSKGHPYRVECHADGALLKAVGDVAAGQPEFRILPDRDNHTPWGCGDL